MSDENPSGRNWWVLIGIFLLIALIKALANTTPWVHH